MSMDETIIESELKGKTLIVYTHMLKTPNQSMGVREIQRDLGFSSPSVSSYHLQKLLDMGLVENIYGDYRIVKEVKVGVLKHFVYLGGVMLPRYLFYAVLVTTMLFTYLFQNPFTLTRQNLTTIMMGVVPSIIFWYETIKIWMERPR